MFDAESLAMLDAQYCNVILDDKMDITLQSQNIGHYWYLHFTGYSTEEDLVIFNKHRFQGGYYQHGRVCTMRHAVKSIKGHDDYQIKVRRTV